MAILIDNAYYDVHNIPMNTDQIRTELKTLKLSAVAKLAGLHRNTLSNIASGQSEMLASTAEKIAAAIKTLKAKKKPGQK